MRENQRLSIASRAAKHMSTISVGTYSITVQYSTTVPIVRLFLVKSLLVD